MSAAWLAEAREAWRGQQECERVFREHGSTANRRFNRRLWSIQWFGPPIALGSYWLTQWLSSPAWLEPAMHCLATLVSVVVVSALISLFAASLYLPLAWNTFLALHAVSPRGCHLARYRGYLPWLLWLGAGLAVLQLADDQARGVTVGLEQAWWSLIVVVLPTLFHVLGSLAISVRTFGLRRPVDHLALLGMVVIVTLASCGGLAWMNREHHDWTVVLRGPLTLAFVVAGIVLGLRAQMVQFAHVPPCERINPFEFQRRVRYSTSSGKAEAVPETNEGEA